MEFIFVIVLCFSFLLIFNSLLHDLSRPYDVRYVYPTCDKCPNRNNCKDIFLKKYRKELLTMRNLKVDFDKVQKYIKDNGDKPIYLAYKELNSKKLKNLSNEEVLVLSYLKLNKRKLGIK